MRYQQLIERVINLFDPEEKEKYSDEVWNILQSSYAKIGGFKSAANIEELTQKTNLWKLIKRDGVITAVGIYKDSLGRKSIASGTNGSDQGKRDYLMIKNEDMKFKRAWAEVSGPAEKMLIRGGAKPIPNTLAGALTGKDITELNPDGFHYTRRIAGEQHEKAIYGFVALTPEVQQKLVDAGIDLHSLPDNIKMGH
jgi:hypothetical protein